MTDSVAGLPSASAFHMSTDEFRRMGHDLIDFIADYRDSVEEYPVLSQVQPRDVLDQLPVTPPEHGDGLATLIDDLNNVIVPGLSQWQSPNFHAYYSANASLPSVLGELVTAGFGVNGMLWATSPAATELEMRVLDWLVELCALPQTFASDGPGGGVILDSASSSLLTAAVAARHRMVGHERAPDLVAYTSDQAHSSVVKGLRVAGFADDQLRVIQHDDDYAMSADALALAMQTDVDAGRVPFFVVATVGTTSSAAFDPVSEVAALCEQHGAWLHVDAAYAGSAAVVPELRFVNRGLDRADSYCFNPHKWLLTNVDCSLLYVADRAPLNNALSIVPDYLQNDRSADDDVIDYRDWQIPLGRRFRALKLWMVIRWYGAEGLRTHIRDHVAVGRRLSALVDADPRFERLTPTSLPVVCFAHIDGDARSRTILNAINASGRHHISHTVLDGRYTIRVAIGSVHTTVQHIEALWADIEALA